MFDSSTFVETAVGDSNPATPEPFAISSILLSSDLPKEVRAARISHVRERLIDDAEISRLTEIGHSGSDDPELANRLRVRREALTSCLGSTLICLFIRLPGVGYTVEIDPMNEAIVHWEWQRV